MLREGYSRIDYSYAVNGSIKEVRFYDTQDEPVEAALLGYHKLVNTFTGSKYLQTTTYFDVDGQETDCAEGYSRVEYTWDLETNFRRPLLTSETYFHPDGSFAATPYGYSQIRYERKDTTITSRWLDPEGQPVTLLEGYAAVRDEYDEAGQLIKREYLDAKGQPVSIPQGYAVVKYGHLMGHIASESYYDADGQPQINAYGVHGLQYTYNDNGKLTEVLNMDIDGNPCMSIEGYCRKINIYDEDNETILSTQYEALDGSLALRGQQYAYTHKEYAKDRHSYILQYLDGHGSPVQLKEGYASVLCQLNKNNKLTQEIYLDISGNPVTLKSGLLR